MAWAEPAVQRRNSEQNNYDRAPCLSWGKKKGNPPSSEIARLSDRHASKVGAHTEHDEPLGLLDAGIVRLRVAQGLPVDLAGLLDLVLRAVADKDGLAAPLDDDVLALGDARELDLDLGEREHIRRGGHRAEELGHGGLGDGRGEHAHGADHEVGERAVRGGGGGLVRAQVGHFGRARRRGVHRALVEDGACGDWGFLPVFRFSV